MLSQQSVKMPEFRHGSSGSVNILPPSALNGNGGGPAQGAALPRFEGPRSPPGRQNTSHVPCKFFRQGACQAGSACPFSHDLEKTNDNICKYFAKGNCKFGPKCANVHVLPDGRRINYNKNGSMGGGHLNLGGRLNSELYHPQNAGSALTNSFIRANAAPISPYAPQYAQFARDEGGYPPYPGRTSIDVTVPTIDTSYASNPGSQYGSQRDDDVFRVGLGLSPVPAQGLSVLDAPLPESFDSNGVSWIARHGHHASSLPSKFGLESPPSSLGAAKDGRTSEALKNLHSSAFGDDTRDLFHGIPSSPPGPSDEYYGKRVMHSQRFAKKIGMSASLPKPPEPDWETDFKFEGDLLPETLTDLMTPQEKARRGSRTLEDGARPIYSSNGASGADSPLKFGSPSNSSPSRWGPLFQRHQKEEEDRASRVSTFGHVGSPLRNSSLHPGASPSSRPIARTGSSTDPSAFQASSPRQSSMSLISQQLQRTHLARAESTGSEPGLHPATASRIPSNSLGSGSRSALVADRQISSGSIGNGGSGRFTTPIDEEQPELFFDMEGVDEKKGERRYSGGWNQTGGKASPHLGAIGGSRNGASGSTNGDGQFGV